MNGVAGAVANTECVIMPTVYREAIALGLAEQGRHDVEVEAFDQLPSTNRYLAELGRGAPEEPSRIGTPRLCAVDWQTQGSGTRGKPWLSSRGNITFSLLEDLSRAPGELPGLSLVTGIAAAQVLEALTGVRVQLKWPNDLIVGDEKLGGVLTELLTGIDLPGTRVVTGIGINYRDSDVVSQASLQPGSLQPIALESLSNSLPSRSQLVASIAGHVLAAHQRFCTDGWRPFVASWRRFDYLLDKEVVVLQGDERQEAIARGVDEHGALRVTVAGVERKLYSGEVSVRVAAT